MAQSVVREFARTATTATVASIIDQAPQRPERFLRIVVKTISSLRPAAALFAVRGLTTDRREQALTSPSSARLAPAGRRRWP